MYPRGTIVDPPYQYDPNAAPGKPGGTMNPFTRKVLIEDIQGLRLNKPAITGQAGLCWAIFPPYGMKLTSHNCLSNNICSRSQ
jgi:hypothetical protein